MYRVYDKKKERWVKESVYLSPNETLSTSTKALFGAEKLSLASSQRYIIHRDIGLYDKNKSLIFEGDIVNVEVRDNETGALVLLTGLIAYQTNHAAYYMFDYTHARYYPLNDEICLKMEIIGNVFENDDLLVN